MLPKMRSEFFAHDLSEIVLGRKLRADMNVSGPVATGAAIAGLWIPAQHRIGIQHIDGRMAYTGLESESIPALIQIRVRGTISEAGR